MSDCLVVMNAREIPEVKSALSDLTIAKMWLTGYTEAQLAEDVMIGAMTDAGYDRYIVISDDVIVRPGALSAVTEALDRGHPVATGYSQRTHTDWTVNVTSKPLRGNSPTASAYEFRQFREMVSLAEPYVRTWFTGMSLTGMSREMWQRFPFGCYGADEGGFASDFHLSLRLQRANIPIIAVRDAFCYHWRHAWPQLNLDSKLLVGSVTPSVTVELEIAVG